MNAFAFCPAGSLFGLIWQYGSVESVYAIRSQSMGCLFRSDSGLNLTIVSSKVTVFPDFQVFHTVNKLSKNFKLELCFIPSRVASLQVVKSTAFSVLPN